MTKLKPVLGAFYAIQPSSKSGLDYSYCGKLQRRNEARDDSWNTEVVVGRHSHTVANASVIFVNENENGEKRENNEFVNEN